MVFVLGGLTSHGCMEMLCFVDIPTGRCDRWSVDIRLPAVRVDDDDAAGNAAGTGRCLVIITTAYEFAVGMIVNVQLAWWYGIVCYPRKYSGTDLPRCLQEPGLWYAYSLQL